MGVLGEQKLQAEIANLNATTARLNGETQEFLREAWWYPVVVAGGFMGAVLALAKLLG